ncbi:Mu transposase domain-containing protein [Fundicoccus culcitae]|uniref:Transposase n=1 Tax=Fundicoccus culcitae TaxID=2969821 RepID=A0ABY5P8Z8_9LACT|nr:transposase [Fundicoccus culcitae]UUX35214.1 transposase [Fundicoccus culcitae]UUX35222.1 transposase [Fundicoccus culcitae]
MKQENWIQAHVSMFQFFGGVTSMIVCDNLRTSMVKHPKNGDVILNAQYRELTDYYRTVVIPAQPRTPNGKASVESTVGKISSQIIAKLRHETFHSVYEANQAVQELLIEFNHKGFQKRKGSRLSVFTEEEKEFFQPLPTNPYQYGVWKVATVQYHYHVSVDKMFYSVPYECIKKKVDVRITKRLIEVFFKQKRICSHPRLYGQPGQYSTRQDQMPLTHQEASEWNGTRFIKWAKQIGENTQTVIERLLASYRIEQQAYNGCRSLLKLADLHTPQELESACQKALSLIYAPRYKNIKRILETNQTKQNQPTKETPENGSTHAFLRGSQYYGGSQDESTQL